MSGHFLVLANAEFYYEKKIRNNEIISQQLEALGAKSRSQNILILLR